MKQETQIFETKTFGKQTKENNLYLVQWTYCSNFGFYYVWANNEQQARESSIYGNKVRFIITKLDLKSMPMEFIAEEEN